MEFHQNHATMHKISPPPIALNIFNYVKYLLQNSNIFQLFLLSFRTSFY